MRLARRRLLVTGAASGIGLAVACLFRREGARVAMLDRDAARLQAVAEDAIPLVCDVADEGQVRQAVAQAASALGGLDGVVNSAGIDLLRRFEEMTAAEWVQPVPPPGAGAREEEGHGVTDHQREHSVTVRPRARVRPMISR